MVLFPSQSRPTDHGALHLQAGRSPLELLVPLLCLGLLGCGHEEESKEAKESSSASPQTEQVADAEPKRPAAEPLSSIPIDHGQLETAPPKDAPRIYSTTVAATVYAAPNTKGRRLGYVRLGRSIRRDLGATTGRGCKGDWYRVYPMGYVCTEDATTDAEDPVVRAASVGPALDKPLPYQYGFVRATAPQYLRIPTKEAQLKSEFGLTEHLDWFAEHRDEVQVKVLGANDVPLDERGVAAPGLSHPAGFRRTTDRSLAELFGARSPDEGPPFWLVGHERKIPNVSTFQVPDYAWFADRVRRHTGLSFVGSFDTKDEELERRFGITVDLRLIPTTKVKPDSGSPFHGIEIPKAMHFPFAWVLKRDVTLFRLIKGQDIARPAESAPKRAIVPLSGKARIKEGQRFYQTLGDATRWLRASDIGIVHHPKEWPVPAVEGKKWIDISLGQQTLVLYEGKRARYATLVSTGRDRFGDPEKDLATPQGDFTLQSKHIAAAMDSEENSSVSGGQKSRKSKMDAEGRATMARLKKAVAAGKKLSGDDERRWTNIKKGRHPEYGVTRRRGATGFELRDVPWIQYFSKGYALHGAYWHDVFGIPRSHGCVNLAPIDARIVFGWTDPPVPDGWHGINIDSDMGESTHVHIRK